jgi:hypothetical protein
VILPYSREGPEIADIWHATNKKQGPKSKSKNDSNFSAIRRPGFFLPRTDLEHHLVVGVDDIKDLPNCPINFEYGKPFLPDTTIAGVPSDMQRKHGWYMRACKLGLTSMRARYVSVFNRLPTEGYTQGGKFWVRRRRDQELEGARNTKLR